MREAPSLALVTALQDMGSRVRAFDPAGMSQAEGVLENVVYCDSAYECVGGADALVIATEWEQFRALDLERVRDLMASPVVVDLRNIYRPEEMFKYGFAYACVGMSSQTLESQRAGASPLGQVVSLTNLKNEVRRA
jgi:UDPglucose 6-dehydrogenase